MKIFLDTEFTHFESSDLISLGMSAEVGDSFYVELTDTWRLEDCSLFTLVHVLPLLSDGRVGEVLSNKLGPYFETIQWLTDPMPVPAEKALSEEVRKDDQVMEWARKMTLKPEFEYLRVKDCELIASLLKGMDCCSLGIGQMKAETASADLSTWLINQGGQLEIISDFVTDERLFLSLLGLSESDLKGKVSLVNICDALGIDENDDDADFRIQQLKEKFYHAGAKRHHALHDAVVLNHVFHYF